MIHDTQTGKFQPGRVVQRGVTGFTPAKLTDPAFAGVTQSIRDLPPCWIREDLLFWEICWHPDQPLNTTRLDAILKLHAGTKHKLQINIVPCPHPSAVGWQKFVGGPWSQWFRPDFRLWTQIRASVQQCLDHCTQTWERLGGRKESLRFEWYNEPATGHVSGGDPKQEPKGTWNRVFHAFNRYLLIGPDELDFHGYLVAGPTLSMWGQKEAERVEIETSPGSDDGQWWSRMQRRCFNIGVYCPRPVTSVEEAVEFHRAELERVMTLMQRLPVPIAKGNLCIHEWYVTKPMLGYLRGECDDSFRAECMVGIGESIASYRDIELALFFTHYFPKASMKTPYDEHSAFSGPARLAMLQYLKG